jgi:hypothetical protein
LYSNFSCEENPFSVKGFSLLESDNIKILLYSFDISLISARFLSPRAVFSDPEPRSALLEGICIVLGRKLRIREAQMTRSSVILNRKTTLNQPFRLLSEKEEGEVELRMDAGH